MPFRIPLHKHFHDEADSEAVLSVIRRGMHWANGPEIEQLEKELAAYSGLPHALAFSNGTCALHALMLASGIGPGDEVIVPSFTFIATANAVLFTGAKPVFADIEPNTLALDAQDVRRRITRKTKAIMPIHYAGTPASQINGLAALAKEKNLLLLEDAAESIGAKLGGKMTGAFGDAGVYSFCANKVITSGEGGAVVTRSREMHEKLKLLRSHGRAETENYFESSQHMDYVALGYNFRMPSMVAALALSQLRKIDKIISLRRSVAQHYGRLLAPLSGVTLPADGGELFSVYQLYTIRLKDRAARDGLKKHLEGAGIMCKVYFEPVHLTHFYKNVLKYSERLPVTEETASRVLSLPIYADMKKEEIELVCGEIKRYFQGG